MLEDRLRAIPALRDVPVPARQAIADLLTPLRLGAGELLFTAGDPADALYVVGHGWLRAEQGSTGRELAMIGAGSVLGEVGVLLGAPRSATVRATSEVELWRLARSDVEQLVVSHPAVGLALSRQMGHHLLQDSRGVGRAARVVVVPSAGMVQLAGAVAATGAGTAVLSLDGRPGPVPDGVTVLSPRLSGPDDLLALVSESIDGVQVLVIGLPPQDGELQQAAAAIADHSIDLGARLPRWARDRVTAVRRLGPPATPAQLARAARVVGGRAIGLALSSGGSKTVAHIGVVRVLREEGVTIDAIAGTSGGAITAACMAFGADHETIVERMRELPEAFRYRRLVPRFPPRLSLFRGTNVVRIFERWFGDADLSSAEVPLHVVTADVATGEEVVLRRGPVALAVRASMGIPAVFPPIAWDGRWLTDGGIVTPLPTGPLRDAGIARVVASNVAGQDPALRASPSRAPRLVETIGRIVAAMEREVLGPEMAMADVQIRPVVRAANSFDFRKADDYLAEGERAAREALPAVLALLGK